MNFREGRLLRVFKGEGRKGLLLKFWGLLVVFF